MAKVQIFSAIRKDRESGFCRLYENVNIHWAEIMIAWLVWCLCVDHIWRWPVEKLKKLTLNRAKSTNLWPSIFHIWHLCHFATSWHWCDHCSFSERRRCNQNTVLFKLRNNPIDFPGFPSPDFLQWSQFSCISPDLWQHLNFTPFPHNYHNLIMVLCIVWPGRTPKQTQQNKVMTVCESEGKGKLKFSIIF